MKINFQINIKYFVKIDVLFNTRMHSSRMCASFLGGCFLPGWVLPSQRGGCFLPGWIPSQGWGQLVSQHVLRQTPPVNRITHMSKNITLTTTSLRLVIILEIDIAKIILICHYRPQQSWAKVMFLQAYVILSMGGGICLSACWDINPPGADPPPQEQTPPKSRLPKSRTPPPPGSRLRHTIIERPVRILLECILVFK